MKIKYPAVGVCGLSCRLCPAYHAKKPWCGGGCKTKTRMAVGCPFITCAVKKKGIEFCWECDENKTCVKWKRHRRYGKSKDSFKCYQTLENDIAYIRKNGVAKFEAQMKIREGLLRRMLSGFNDGRSKTYYSIAATVVEIGELKNALEKAGKEAKGRDDKDRAATLHAVLDGIAREKGYVLRLRK